MSGLLGAFLVEMALVTYRSVTQGGTQPTAAPIKAPLPSLYTSGIVVYGGLAIFASASSSIAPVATLVGWGFVVATFFGVLTPGSANAAAASNATLAKGLTTTTAGKTTTGLATTVPAK